MRKPKNARLSAYKTGYYHHDMMGRELDCCNCAITNKDTKIRTFMHYSDPDADKELTVFGRKREGLFYNYDDRLYGDAWTEGCKLAAEQAQPQTARFYEIALNHFHQTNDVNIEHIILGCNRSNGFSYLVFGYTYTRKN